jgi:SpoVK/Ycf46/Vps4 family AAA+-type ATPase
VAGLVAVELLRASHIKPWADCANDGERLVDALGKQRGNPLDVGELDRVVISLMQELEHSQPAGLVVATSNIPGQLDDAFWRRFDLAVGYEAPDARALRSFLERKAGDYGLSGECQRV